MTRQEFTYVVETEKPFQEALEAVQQVAKSHNWKLLGDHDLGKLASSVEGGPKESATLLEICSSRPADALLQADRMAALSMPCSVLISTEQGKTKLAALQPEAVMSQIFPEASRQAKTHLDQITTELRSIMDEAAR